MLGLFGGVGLREGIGEGMGEDSEVGVARGGSLMSELREGAVSHKSAATNAMATYGSNRRLPALGRGGAGGGSAVGGGLWGFGGRGLVPGRGSVEGGARGSCGLLAAAKRRARS